MTTGLIVGLAAGAAVGLVVGLLVRTGLVTAARTAEARLADAAARARAQDGELADVRARLADEQRAVAEQRAEVARLSTELTHADRAAEERAAAFDEVRAQLTGEFTRLSTQALRQNNEHFLQLADLKLGRPDRPPRVSWPNGRRRSSSCSGRSPSSSGSTRRGCSVWRWSASAPTPR